MPLNEITYQPPCEALEDLNARILAADPDDSPRMANLRDAIEDMLRSVEFGSEAADLLKCGLRALRVIEDRRPADAPALLGAIAGAVAAAVQSRTADEQAKRASIAEATATLSQLLDPLGESRQTSSPYAAPALVPEPVTPPEPSPRPAASEIDVEPEIVKEFIAESCDRISAAEASLLALEKDPGDAEQINTILRAFHTIKGASGFLGLDSIQQLAHHAESLFIQARDAQTSISGPVADLSFQSCDLLRSMIVGLEHLAPGQTCSEPQGYRQLLSALKAQDQPSEAFNAASSAAAQAAPPVTADDRDDRLSPAAIPTRPVDQPASPLPRIPGVSGEGTIRVGTDRLDELVNMVGEMVIAHSIIAQASTATRGGDAQLSRSVAHAGKIVRRLQDLTMSLRMVPLCGTFQKMARLVRDLAHKSGKQVLLTTQGEDTEIDRNMVELVTDPLVHMIRNAVDHGVELPGDRARAGKSETGTIRLQAYHSAGNVVIELEDDGRGFDRRRILGQAVARGLVPHDQELSDAEIDALIFQPGLSTAQTVTDVSGRGVGMDVVKRNVDQIRGRVEVQSTPGRGSRFILRLPLTMAIADAMLLRVGKERYLLPTIAIERSFRPRPGEVATVAGRGEMVQHRGSLLPLFRLHTLFGIESAVTDPTAALLIVIEGNGQRCAIMVDELLSQQQVVIKSLGPAFADVRGVSGAGILGDGRVGLILDCGGLIGLAHGSAGP